MVSLRGALVALALGAAFVPGIARADLNPPVGGAPATVVTMPPVAPEAATAQMPVVSQPMQAPQSPAPVATAYDGGIGTPPPFPIATPGWLETSIGNSLHLSNMRAQAFTVGSSCLAAFVGIMALFIGIMAMIQVRSLGQHLGDLLFRALQAFGLLTFMAFYANFLMLGASFACRSAINITTGSSNQLAGWGSQGTCTDINFTSMFVYGIQESLKIVGANVFGVPLILTPGVGNIVQTAAFLVFAAFVFIGLENFAITIELLVVSAIGPVFIMFFGFDPLKHLSSGATTYPISVITRYFFNWLFIGIGISAIAVLDAQHDGFQGLSDVFMVLVGVFAWIYLIFRMNRLSKTMMDGQSRFNAMQEFVKPALDVLTRVMQIVAIAGTGGAAAPAVAAGSNALATISEAAGAGMGGPGPGGPGGASGGGNGWGGPGGPTAPPSGGGGSGFFELARGNADYGDDPMEEIEPSIPPPSLTGANAERRASLSPSPQLALPPPPPPIAASSALGSGASTTSSSAAQSGTPSNASRGAGVEDVADASTPPSDAGRAPGTEDDARVPVPPLTTVGANSQRPIDTTSLFPGAGARQSIVGGVPGPSHADSVSAEDRVAVGSANDAGPRVPSADRERGRIDAGTSSAATSEGPISRPPSPVQQRSTESATIEASTPAGGASVSSRAASATGLVGSPPIPASAVAPPPAAAGSGPELAYESVSPVRSDADTVQDLGIARPVTSRRFASADPTEGRGSWEPPRPESPGASSEAPQPAPREAQPSQGSAPSAAARQRLSVSADANTVTRRVREELREAAEAIRGISAADIRVSGPDLD
jgi:hypothetical protein